MTRYAIILSLAAAILLLGASFGNPGQNPAEEPDIPLFLQDTFDQAKALAQLREQIKGRENLPADSVFQHIKMLQKMPAGRLLAIMEFGYAKSLGVTCAHCHNPNAWESEEKPTKQITREMAAMVNTLNTDLLANIKNLNHKPVVNCTTCHRGQVKPAISMDK